MSYGAQTITIGTENVWEDHPDIPDGWKYQVDGDVVRFLTSDGSVLDSAEQVVSYIDESDNSLEESSFFDDKDEEESENENTEEQRTVPRGWQVNKTRIISSSGKVFKTRRIAFKEMIDSGDYSTKEIEDMKTCLKFEGWEDHCNLPSGWLMKRRSKKVFLCATDGKMFSSIVEASRYARQYPDYMAEDDMKKLDNFGKNAAKPASAPDDTAGWEESDGTVPRGWKIKSSDGAGSVSIKDREGTVFSSRRKALLHLKTSGGSQEDIELLRESLVEDGWCQSDRLPEEWLYKTESGDYSFLTNTAQKIRGRTDTVKFMKKNLLYSQEEIRNIEHFGQPLSRTKKSKKQKKKTEIKEITPKKTKKEKSPKRKSEKSVDGWLSDSELPSGWRYKENKDTKVVLSPGGKKFTGISSAIRFLSKENSVKEVVQMREFLGKFGWRPDPKLPEGWRVKKGDKRYDYCSPTGDVIRSKQELRKYLGREI